MAKTDYQIALDKLQLAAGHIESGFYDTARTVLSSAYHSGELARPEHLPGLLQHDALQAFLLLKDGRNVTRASAALRAVTGQLSRVRGKQAQHAVFQCCEFVMASFPHVAEIQNELKSALKEAQRKKYEAAYERINKARALLQQNRDLTPQAIQPQITATATEVMAHLLENNPTKVAVEIAARLQARGLIQG